MKRAFIVGLVTGAVAGLPAAAAAKKPVPVNSAAPTITGTPVVGNLLQATTGSWTNSPTSYSYQWQRCDSTGSACTSIASAAAASYTVAQADLGHTLRVVVTARNSFGAGVPASSNPTATVTAPPPPQATPATAYQLNPAHTGVTPDGFSVTATRRWSVNFTGAVSYPLIAGNQVFVTTAGSGGPLLYALDAGTGAITWGPVSLGGTYPWAGLTYEGGNVFTVNSSGTMQAFNATTGTLNWSAQLPGQYSFSSPPTALGGVVYVGGAGTGGTLYAVDEATGNLDWTGAVMNGDDSSPAASSSGVYVSYACGQTYDFAPTTGSLIWHRSTSCEGGGGKTPVLANGRLYVRDSSFPAILDAASGTLEGTFAASGPAPAVSSTAVYDLQNGTLTASGTTPGSPVSWSFAGDGTLSSAPVVSGDDVFIAGTSGEIYALSAAGGTVVWSANAGSGIPAPDEQNVSQPLTGLAVSGGLLVVPAGSTLVAYR